MKKGLTVLLILLVTAFLSVGVFQNEAEAAAKKLKWAHVYETSETFHKWALWSAEEIAKRTNDAYKIEVYPASSLGKESDIVQGLSLGTVDIVYAGTAFIASTYGPIGIGEAPFMFRDFDHWKKFAQSPLFGELAGGYLEASGGNKIPAVTYYGVRCVTSKKPINSPADMKGLKIRVPDAPLYLMFTQSVGANAAPIAFAEVYLALQQGVVDAQENPLPTIKAKKFYEVQKYINLTQHMTNNLVTIIGAPAWKKLSDADKKIFTEVMQEAAMKNSEEVRKQEDDLIPWFEQQGVTINKVDRKPFMEAAKPFLTGPKATWTKEQFQKLQDIK
jgi:tripartite ATP-independent transporter DctP family solute receptor